jgi:hypothetical protein
MQKDNSTLRLKVQLRRNALKLIKNPVVMETHGGNGAIFLKCYFGIENGVVFEHKPEKTAVLAKQRPTWAVYECDSESAIKAGAGNHLEINFLDLDPYGEPWPIVDAYFGSNRLFAPKMAVVVNDGLRQSLKMNGGWNVGSMKSAVEKWGNNALYASYIDVCQELLKEKAGQVGYTLTRWAGYYCSHAEQMTHYAAILEK